MRIAEIDPGLLDEIAEGIAEGRVIPYLGPGLFPSGTHFPVDHQELVNRLCAKVSVPGRIRNNLPAAAQYIENFKHRKTLTRCVEEAFREDCAPTRSHRLLASLPTFPLIVDTWYDSTMAKVLTSEEGRGRKVCQLTAVSPADRPGEWFRTYDCDAREDARTILYKPHGCVYPEPHFVISDSDYVEVLTEIDIQTPIPQVIRELRTDRHFLFLGCRFNQQLSRIFARQIMKRSSGRHWAVLPEETTPNESRFLERENIVPVKSDPEKFLEALVGQLSAASPCDTEASCRSV